MAQYMFNISKGRAVEFYRRVKANDPADAKFIFVPLSATDTEANRQDDDNLSVFLAAAPNEQSSGNWNRKTITDSELAAFPAPDDTNNRYGIQIPQLQWSPGPTTSNNTVGLFWGYTEVASPADTDWIAIGHFDFPVTADGNVVTINVGDMLRAS